MERMSGRLAAIESAVLKKLGRTGRKSLGAYYVKGKTPPSQTVTEFFTFQEACMYIGVSESAVQAHIELRRYCTTNRGKMVYFCQGGIGRMAVAEL